MDKTSNANELFNNLKALEDASFPKMCSGCKTRFANEAEYFENTRPYAADSGLSESRSNTSVYVKLARRCHCGQPIVDFFGDRRDTSARGQLKRRAFDKVIASLQEKGLTLAQARQELLKHMRNRSSRVLESLGVFSQGQKEQN